VTSFGRLILFTGAGFTKDFGGALASEMWERIFNNPLIQRTPELASVMRRDSDFESVYATVLRGSVHSPEEKTSLKAAMAAAYASLDNEISDWICMNQPQGALEAHDAFFDLLRDKHGPLFFTLNQDLFIERSNGLLERNRGFATPGVPHLTLEPTTGEDATLNVDGFVGLPGPRDAEAGFRGDTDSQATIVYVKLHGSYGWKSCNGGDQLVLGHDKENEIDREPLLREYWRFFKEMINEGNKRMLIVGYGFRDQHVNKALLEAIEIHGLKLCVVDPRSIGQLHEDHGGE
jgi:hypothetical protein